MSKTVSIRDPKLIAMIAQSEHDRIEQRLQEAIDARPEPCGCNEDFFCPCAEALWADANAAYRRAIRTPDTDEAEYDAAWERYEDALCAYRAHRQAAGLSAA